MSRRLLFGLTMTKNFFLFLRVPQRCSDEEETLFRFYVDTVLMAGWRRKQTEVFLLLSPPMPSTLTLQRLNNDEWHSVLVMCREKARVILAELIAFVLFPAETKCRTGGDEGCEGDGDAREEQSEDPGNPIPFPLRRRLMMVRYLAGEIPHNRHHLINLLEVGLGW